MAIESMRIRLLSDQPRGKKGDEIVVRTWEGEQMIGDGSGELARNDEDTSNAAPVETGNAERDNVAARNRTEASVEVGVGSSHTRVSEQQKTPAVQATNTTKARVETANARSKARKAKR